MSSLLFFICNVLVHTSSGHVCGYIELRLIAAALLCLLMVAFMSLDSCCSIIVI